MFFIYASVSRALREATYPFLALICLRDNRMTVVGRMEGMFSQVTLYFVKTMLCGSNVTSFFLKR